MMGSWLGPKWQTFPRPLCWPKVAKWISAAQNSETTIASNKLTDFLHSGMYQLLLLKGIATTIYTPRAIHSYEMCCWTATIQGTVGLKWVSEEIFIVACMVHGCYYIPFNFYTAAQPVTRFVYYPNLDDFCKSFKSGHFLSSQSGWFRTCL